MEPSERRALRRLLDVIAATEGSAGQGLRLPGGVQWRPYEMHGPVHLIDGDGASLCEQVAAADLVRIGPAAWSRAERERRCARCEFLLLVYRGQCS